MTCPACASFFRRPIAPRPLLLTCTLALLVVAALATVGGSAGAPRELAALALMKKAAAVLPAPGTTATFNINANGAKEVTNAGTPNQGDVDGAAIGTITFDNGTGSGSTGSAVINLTLTNLDVGTIDLTGHHIHQAPSTTTGAIVIDFGDPDTIRSGNTLNGTITGLPAATITSLMANPSGFYYNLHNAQFTGGAVRDQLGDVSQTGPTLTVNSTADPGDGVCTVADCTLREAITAANSAPGLDTITFDATVFAAPGPHTIQLTTALPDLSTDMTISGPGARVLSVRGEGASDRYRIFTIPGGTVNISGLTVTNGYTADGSTGVNGGDGGGIRNAGTLTLTGVAVVGNRTGNGGSSAASGGVGGGIRNLGTLTITDSTISGNQTGDGGPDPDAVGGPGGTGGGISNALGTLTITNSTISGNQTGNGGGGAISGSRGEGGGIHSGNAALTITGSTITTNTASGGGGIRRNGSGTVTLRSTIVAGNSATSGPDIRGTVQSDGYNLVRNTANAVINQNSGAGPNITGVDPQLQPLADNGGQTDTHALTPVSQAIDKGKSFGSTTDQRGQTRPLDLDAAAYPDASGGDGADIGAYEVQAADPQFTPILVNTTVDATDTNTSDGLCDYDAGMAGEQCTLRAAVQEANARAGVNVISFDTNVFNTPGPHTIQLAGALPDLSSSMTINGPGARVLSVRRDSGFRFRIFTVTSGVTVNISGLTVTNGNTANGAPGQPGGGIRNQGTLTLTGVAVSGNQAGNGAGCANCTGGIGGDGGGISNDGTLNLVNSTVSGNQAGLGGNGFNLNGIGSNGGNGGGINNNGTLTITNSTISGNQTNAGGTGNLGNGVGGSGGGISNNGTLTVSNSTITANISANEGGGIHRSGGGITLRNTIVAGNSASVGPDINGTVQSDGFNLVQNTTGATINQNMGAGPNITGQDPELLPLTNNGGPTDTHALADTSPALDQGDDGSASPTTDQRGQTRPFDVASIAPATGGDNSDIGAFELILNEAPVAVAPSPTPSTNEDTQTTITLTGTDADDNGLTFTVTDAPDNGSLVPLAAPDCTATNTCTQSFTYTPTPDYFGGDSFKFKVNDGTVDSAEETVTITINSVNDAPSFIKGADQTVVNSSPQNVTNWATNISAGPANESGQTVHFEVSNNNNALFTAQPAIDPSGTLSFTPAPGVIGKATVTVVLKDDGGTSNGGQDTSAQETFTITVNLTGWTTSGANGATEDESNPVRPTYTNFTASANPGSPAGTYVLRYNITAMGNLTLPGAVSTRLRVRFRDDGAGSQVTIAIIRSSILGGSETLGTIFDSDAYVAGSGFQTKEILMPALLFDFTQNTYWLEVRMTKAAELNQPGIGSVQLNQQ